MREKSIRESLNGGLALFVLDRLVQVGRIKADEIRQLVASLPDEMRAIERRLEQLRGGASGGKEVATTPPRPKRGRRRQGERKPTKTPAAGGKALGGTYGGLIRRVPKREQAEYVRIKHERGIEAAITALRARSR